MTGHKESTRQELLKHCGCAVTDDNYWRYGGTGSTTQVRVAGITQLILVSPSGQPCYWRLELPWLAGGKSITLGEVIRLPPSLAKPLAQKLLQGPRKTHQDGLTLKQLLWIYKRFHVIHLARGSQLSIGSYSRRLAEAFGDEPVAWITGPAVRKWHAEYSRRSPGAADEARFLLRTLINCAKDWDLLPADHPNPCAGIRRNRRGAGHRSFSPDELRALGIALDNDERSVRYISQARRVRFMLFTGGRPGEIRTLHWEHVIFDSGVPSHLQIPKSKTGPRRIELNKAAREILLAQKSATTNSTGAVFPIHAHWRRHYSEQQAKDYWSRLSKLAGLPNDSRQYWLRHSFGTSSILAGGSLSATGALLGHVRPSTTQRYLHLPEEHVIAAGLRIGNRIADWMGIPDEPPSVLGCITDIDHMAHHVSTSASIVSPQS
jgi:integrase